MIGCVYLGSLVLVQVQHLQLAAAVAVSSAAFAAVSPGQQVPAQHIVFGGAVGEVDCLSFQNKNEERNKNKTKTVR